jgi:cell division protein FtsN
MNDHDDDSRLGAYAPSADDLATFDAREEEDERGPLLLIAAVVALVMFGAVVWVAYSNGVSDGGANRIPRVAANEDPYRVRPEDPGGVETPDTQYEVYDRLAGGEEASENVSPRPATEQLIDGSRPAVSIETVDADQTDAETADVPAGASPDITPRPAPARPQDNTPPPATQTAETQSEPAQAEPAQAEPAQAEPAQAEPAQAEPAQAEPAQAEPVAETPPAATTPAVSAGVAGVDVTGAWVVQIASFRTAADAEAAWLAFRTRYSDISTGLAPDVASAEIEGRGTYHRLRIAAFTTRDAANAFCATLQSRGQDCLVRGR